jgi:hypothetical protein
MIPSDLFHLGSVGELSDPSAPYRGTLGGSLDARPGGISDPGAAAHSQAVRPETNHPVVTIGRDLRAEVFD